MLSSYDFISLVTTSQTTIDQFSLVYTCTPTAHFETTKRYEAEDTFVLLTDGDFSGRYINNPSASGGKLMGNLDVGDTFHVRHFAPIAGIRTIRTLYVNGEANQKMCYGVNGGKIMIDIPAQVEGSWDFANSSLLSFTANLRQGWNDIVFGCTGGYAQYDYFEVVGTDARYDSSKLETLASHAMVYAVECEKEGSASRSRGWGYDFFANSCIGLEGDDNNGFTAVFNIMKAGTYNVKFVYGVDHAMTVRVSVNSGALNVVNLTGGPTWHALVEQTIECTFVEGTNSIRIMRNGSWCNFDAVYVDIK